MKDVNATAVMEGQAPFADAKGYSPEKFAARLYEVTNGLKKGSKSDSSFEQLVQDIDQWSASDWQSIRNKSTDEGRRINNALEGMIGKFPSNLRNTEYLYRGLTLDAVSKSALKDLQAGKEFDMKGLSSWSSNTHTALHFATVSETKSQAAKDAKFNHSLTSVVLRVRSKNVSNSTVDISFATPWRQMESEVLMSSKQKLKCTGSQWVNINGRDVLIADLEPQ